MLRYINFGMQPLANALRDPAEPLSGEFRAPLAVQACPGCKLSQLTHVVPAERMYTEYAYRSGISPAWRAHCDALAFAHLRPGAFVLDIASNDGTLLETFASRGADVLGVEPSHSFDNCDYPRITAYWSKQLAEAQGLTARADIVVAQNVLGHVDDVHDFLAGVALVLKPDGVALIEVPYLGSLFDNLAFDTIYHEHLSYWSVTALREAATRAGLTLRDITPLPHIHGGSIRATLVKAGKPTDSVNAYLVAELHNFNRSAYMRFSARVTRAIARINEELLCQTPYIGFGAAAKTTVMLGCLDPRAYPCVVYDDNSHKQGKMIPGTRVRIEAPPQDWASAPGPMCNFVWTQHNDIVRRLRSAGYDGAIYAPLPRGEWNELE